MSTIQQNWNGLLRWYKFADGHLLDVTGNGSGLTSSGSLKFNRDGILLDGVSDSLEGDSVNVSSAITVIARLNPYKLDHAGGSNQSRILGKNSCYAFYVNSSGRLQIITIGVSTTTQSSTSLIKPGEESVVAFSYSATTGTRKIFIDGVADSTVTGLTGNIVQNSNNLMIGSSSGLINFWDGLFSDIMIFNTTVSDTDIAAIGTELQTMKRDIRVLPKSRQDSYIDTTDPSLLAWLDFNVLTGDVVDKAGNNNDATITGNGTDVDTDLGNAIKLAGSSNYAVITSPSAPLAGVTSNGTMGFSGWVNPAATGVQALVSQQDGTGTGRSWLTFFEAGGPSGADIASFLGGSALHSEVIPGLGQWYHVVVNYLAQAGGDPYGKLQLYVDNVLTVEEVRDIDEGADGDINLTVAKAFIQGSGAAIHDFIFWSRGRTLAEVDALYNKGVIQYQGGYGVTETDNLTSGFLDGIPLRINSGTFKVSASLIDGEPVKAIKSIFSGQAYAKVQELNMTTTEAAYGTWEYWLRNPVKTRVHSTQIVASEIGGPTATNQNGYDIRVAANNSIKLVRSDNGVATVIMSTVADYVSEDTWYGIKVTRSSAGEFIVYIRGGSFGNDYVQIVADSGTNPITDTTHTTSNYLSFDTDNDDETIWSSRNDKYCFSKNLLVK